MQMQQKDDPRLEPILGTNSTTTLSSIFGRKAMQMQQKDDPWIEPILGMGGQSKDFSNGNVNFKEIMLARQKEFFKIGEHIRITAKALFFLQTRFITLAINPNSSRMHTTSLGAWPSDCRLIT
ncbi:unnamed protein product [Larinioides sclopetarius]|uniref:Uncharacterized protein n=1 Tax=Larinioides sclopetarius TaxID=280406 RepID=A0AAV2C0Z9_9ARAC